MILRVILLLKGDISRDNNALHVPIKKLSIISKLYQRYNETYYN